MHNIKKQIMAKSKKKKSKKKETPDKPRDIRVMKSIKQQTYGDLLDYLSRRPYIEVAHLIDSLGRAIDTKVEVVPDNEE